eukprot:m.110093 g.110093  ORF g.110093 m.110093 type:complete len:148 (+) comp16970_c0_seq3:354-797(+)
MSDTETRIADVEKDIQAVRADLEELRHDRKAAKAAVAAAVEAAKKSIGNADRAAADAAVDDERRKLERIEEHDLASTNLMNNLLLLRAEKSRASTPSGAIVGEQLCTKDEEASHFKRRRNDEGAIFLADCTTRQFDAVDRTCAFVVT